MLRYLTIAALCTGLCACGSIVNTASWPQGAGPLKVDQYYYLPRGYLPLKIACAEGTLTVEAQNVLQLPDPSPSNRFVVDYQPNSFSNDTVSVETTSDGLLKSVNATSENQTSEISAALVNLIKSASLAYASGKDSHPDIICKPKLRFKRTLLIDIANLLATGEERIDNNGIWLKHGSQTAYSKTLQATEATVPTTTGERKSPGIYYRPARSAIFDLQYCGSASTANECKEYHEDQLFVVAPDTTQIFYIPFNRKFFTKFNVELNFDRGMLTKFKSTDDSEVLGALNLPAEILKNILGLTSTSSATPAK